MTGYPGDGEDFSALDREDVQQHGRSGISRKAQYILDEAKPPVPYVELPNARLSCSRGMVSAVRV